MTYLLPFFHPISCKCSFPAQRDLSPSLTSAVLLKASFMASDLWHHLLLLPWGRPAWRLILFQTHSAYTLLDKVMTKFFCKHSLKSSLFTKGPDFLRMTGTVNILEPEFCPDFLLPFLTLYSRSSGANSAGSQKVTLHPSLLDKTSFISHREATGKTWSPPVAMNSHWHVCDKHLCC